MLVWVEVDDDLRLARGLERDGAAMEPHWRSSWPTSRQLFARDRTRERADVLVDGTGGAAPRRRVTRVVAPSGEQYEIDGGGYRAVVTESGGALRLLEHDGRP